MADLVSYPTDTTLSGDRVRAHSPQPLNRKVDRESQTCVEELASADPVALTQHIATLDREWDVERYLQTNAGIVSLTGVILGATVNPRFLLLPGLVFTFFFQHAVQGWCPPLPVFRRMGVRTRREINREKYALKALRGDFEGVGSDDRPESAAHGRSASGHHGG